MSPAQESPSRAFADLAEQLEALAESLHGLGYTERAEALESLAADCRANARRFAL